MAHPLLFILLFYVGGLITDKHVEAPIPWALSLAAIMCVTIFRSGPSSRTALPALVFLLAWCWQTTHTHTISLSDLRHRFPKPADVKLTGRIRHIDYFPSAKNTYCQIILDLESIGTNGGTQMKTGARILGDVLLTGVPFVRKHDQVQLTGILSPIRTSAYPFAFQPDIYWEARGMHHQIRIDSESMQLVSSATPETGWDRRFMDWASSHLDRELPEDQAAQLMQAMTLGKKNEIPADIHAMFARAGTIHLFAISCCLHI